MPASPDETSATRPARGGEVEGEPRARSSSAPIALSWRVLPAIARRADRGRGDSRRYPSARAEQRARPRACARRGSPGPMPTSASRPRARPIVAWLDRRRGARDRAGRAAATDVAWRRRARPRGRQRPAPRPRRRPSSRWRGTPPRTRRVSRAVSASKAAARKNRAGTPSAAASAMDPGSSVLSSIETIGGDRARRETGLRRGCRAPSAAISSRAAAALAADAERQHRRMQDQRAFVSARMPRSVTRILRAPPRAQAHRPACSQSARPASIDERDRRSPASSAAATGFIALGIGDAPARRRLVERDAEAQIAGGGDRGGAAESSRRARGRARWRRDVRRAAAPRPSRLRPARRPAARPACRRSTAPAARIRMPLAHNPTIGRPAANSSRQQRHHAVVGFVPVAASISRACGRVRAARRAALAGREPRPSGRRRPGAERDNGRRRAAATLIAHGLAAPRCTSDHREIRHARRVDRRERATRWLGRLARST